MGKAILPQEDAIEEIAVIGLAGRFPGAKDIDQFWQNLRDGVESIVHFTEKELEAQGIPSEWLRDPNYVKAAPAVGVSGTQTIGIAHEAGTDGQTILVEVSPGVNSATA